ncbi:MAG TPA: ribosome silencing factor [Candidatus Dormibacteraeota bacterium]|jgi:ribosome-associated protein|nr:ribosome silencing factor [Candidatus Dormibacteraeota bacterium]
MTSRELVEVVREAAESKKARDVVALDLAGRSDVADWFVICEGDTDRQTRAIADAILEAAGNHDLKPFHTSGERDGAWILMDYIVVVVHIFLPGERSFYDLESLWKAAAAQRADGAEPQPAAKAAKATTAKATAAKAKAPKATAPKATAPKATAPKAKAAGAARPARTRKPA